MMPSQSLSSTLGAAASRGPGGFGQQASASTNRSAMWYRFEIDCAAHPSGVSVKSLIKEAESARRKAAAAAASASTSRASSIAAVGTYTSTVAAASSNKADGGANSAAETEPGAGSAPVLGGQPFKPAEGGDAGGIKRPVSSAEFGGGGVAAAACAAIGAVSAAGQTGATEGQKTGAVLPGTEPTDLVLSENHNKEEKRKHSSSKRFRETNRQGGWMSLIERLELKHGGAASGIMTDSDEESSDDSSEEEPSSAEESGDGGEAGDGEGGGDKKKVEKKPKRKIANELDYEDDFIDDSELEKAFYAKAASSKTKTVHSGFFANQGEVETVGPTPKQSGGGKRKQSGGGDGDAVIKKKKPKAAAGTPEAGKGGTNVAAPPKKKTTKNPVEAAGGAAAAAAGVGAIGTKKTPTKGGVATSTSTTGDGDKSPPAATPAGMHTAAASVTKDGTNAPAASTGPAQASDAPGQGVCSGDAGGDSAPAANGSVCSGGGGVGGGGTGSGAATTSFITTTTAGAAGVAESGEESNTSVPGSSSPASAPTAAETAAHTSGSPLASVIGAQTKGAGVEVLSDAGSVLSAETGGAEGAAVAGGSGSIDTVATGGGDGKSGGSDKPATGLKAPTVDDWPPELRAVLAKFEADSKPWVDAGRPRMCKAADDVLDGLRVVDNLVRRSIQSINAPSYLDRLAAVYGHITVLRATLVTLREEEHKKEYAELKAEFQLLKAVFMSKVAANLAANLAEQQTSDGQSATFLWTDSLRAALHDLVRAFEAWVIKGLGGLRTKQAMVASKELYETLAQAWPAEMPMTPEDLKKMYLNEKRRIRTKAIKEAAAESGGLPESKDFVTSRESMTRVPALGAGTPTTTPRTTQSVSTPVSPSPTPALALAELAAGVESGGMSVSLIAEASPPAALPGARTAETTAVVLAPAAPTAAAGVPAAPSSVSSVSPASVHLVSPAIPSVIAPAPALPVATNSNAGSPVFDKQVPKAAGASGKAAPVVQGSDKLLSGSGVGASNGGGSTTANDMAPPSPGLSRWPPRGTAFESPPEYDESEFFELEESEREEGRSGWGLSPRDADGWTS